MKNLFYVFVFAFVSYFNLYPQNPEWINFFRSPLVYSVAIEGDNIWAGGFGIAKINRITGEKTFYYKTNSGLPNNDVRSLAIDGSGNKWIGTDRGLAKFNGTNWTVYNTSNSGLPSDSVLSLAIDGSGNKWIGTHRGLAKFNGTNWTVYNTSNSGLPGDWVSPLAIDGSGNKWIGTNGGLAKFDGTNWTVYNPSNSGLPGDCG